MIKVREVCKCPFARALSETIDIEWRFKWPWRSYHKENDFSSLKVSVRVEDTATGWRSKQLIETFPHRGDRRVIADMLARLGLHGALRQILIEAFLESAGNKDAHLGSLSLTMFPYVKYADVPLSTFSIVWAQDSMTQSICRQTESLGEELLDIVDFVSASSSVPFISR